MRWTEEAFDAMQTSAEEYVTDYLKCAQDLAIHRGAQTILPKDMAMIRLIKKQMKWETDI